MTAPYVKRLLASIDASTDLVARAILKAELAAYWARVGEFEEAERLRAELRHAFGDGRDIRVSILIMCVEGLLLYFRELSPGALDRLARARLLSVASGNASLISLTSAWLAHIHFNGGRYLEMADAISACLESLESTNLPALCRVSMLLGDAHLYAGSTDVSQVWYERARTAAVELGDQAFVGALTYNRSALRVFVARLESASVPQSNDHIRLLAGEVQSAINYQAVARLRSLDHLLATSLIGVQMLKRNFSGAESEIQGLLASIDIKPLSSQACILKADLALCLAHSGSASSSRQLAASILTQDLNQHDAGDRVLIYASLKEATSLCGDANGSDELNGLLVAAQLDHSRHLSSIRDLLLPFQSPPKVD